MCSTKQVFLRQTRTESSAKTLKQFSDKAMDTIQRFALISGKIFSEIVTMRNVINVVEQAIIDEHQGNIRAVWQVSFS